MSGINTVLNTSICYHLLRPPGLNDTTPRVPYIIWDRMPLVDLILGIPVLVFLLFMLSQIRSSIRKLKQSESIIMTTYYGFIWFVCLFNIARITLFILVPQPQDLFNIPFLVANFVLIFMEISVVIFMSHRYMVSGTDALKRTIFISLAIASLNLIAQALLIWLGNIDVFGWDDKRAAIYWVARLMAFEVFYSVLLIIPCSRWRDRLPARPSFYHYVRFLLIQSVFHAIGEWFVVFDLRVGWCFTLTSTFMYYALFAPAIYYFFLWNFFKEVRLPNAYQELVLNNTYED